MHAKPLPGANNMLRHAFNLALSLRSKLLRSAQRARLRRWLIRRDGRQSQQPIAPRLGKSLYAAPIGAAGKDLLAKLIKKWGHEQFDYLIFVYDGSRFDEAIFSRCSFISEPGIVYQFFRKYLTAQRCSAYDYVVLGIEDVDIDSFSWPNFAAIMQRNHLDMASPALSAQSHSPHSIMFQQLGKVGRLVDVIEVFLTVFEARAWLAFRELIEPDKNFWGWGYVQLAQSYCDFKMGIVDAQTITVTRAPTFKQESQDEMTRFLRSHPKVRRARFCCYGELQPALIDIDQKEKS
ncbi:DUF707 domain-containing protein [Rhodoferax sp. U11-2br]|uniref:DUF707 domain-containing protein n=1 Tax=Rhodoferax sp. U11-2br TaxID=2838878 RepID=UPI001BEB88B1|nr:DUF707 domain-containing protein [Rhodoferax sp. U11-2br]MBT3068510.1 DUF707 domain-containing protein [Rhodoferax sp. U11-2br]